MFKGRFEGINTIVKSESSSIPFIIILRVETRKIRGTTIRPAVMRILHAKQLIMNSSTDYPAASKVRSKGFRSNNQGSQAASRHT